jgi:predicted nucleic acid-binding protein
MYLLDTNLVSEFRKLGTGKANAFVEKWAQQVLPEHMYVSVITLQELEIGILLMERRDVHQGQVLRHWFEDRVMPAFKGRVLPIDERVARTSAKLHVPDPRPFRDTLIAATAIIHGLTIATRNVGDFQLPGVGVINPWLQA